MERVVFKCLFNYCRDNLVISDKQSGFTPNDGAINQWVYLYHQFSKAIDEQKEIRVIFGDITKAFDRVHHPGLLQKLANIGIAGDVLISCNTNLLIESGALGPKVGGKCLNT